MKAGFSRWLPANTVTSNYVFEDDINRSNVLNWIGKRQEQSLVVGLNNIGLPGILAGKFCLDPQDDVLEECIGIADIKEVAEDKI